MTDPAPAEMVWTALVTPEFFDVLGVGALYGRTFRAGDPPDTMSFVRNVGGASAGRSD